MRVPPLSRTAPPVGRLKDWTNPKRAPVTRDRNPFKFGGAPRPSPDAPIAKGVSPESLPELPLPLPAADLQLIGIAGTDDGKFTAIVTVGNDLIFSKRQVGRFPEPGEVVKALEGRLTA